MPPSSNAAQQMPEAGADSEPGALPEFGETRFVNDDAEGGSAERYSEGAVVAQRYRLVRRLGEGGMGAVWVAQHLTLGTQVALKLIRTELAGRVSGLSERLLQEARAAAAIGHPGIIQVFDFGVTEHGEPYIGMELLHGESLADVVKRRGRLSAARAVRTLLPVIEALVVANRRGIVHRDLKPDNIFLSRQANRVQPKVLDFGIAKLEQSVAYNLTSEGTVLGSPAYMSPEQARGESDVDFRTDLWALCVVLYECVTGQLPFAGANWHGLMWSIIEGSPVPLSQHGIEEPELWAILSRGFQKDRAQRWPTMFDFGRELAMWLLDRGVTRDICEGSLKSIWLERSPYSGNDAVHSFFPSEAPERRPSDEAPIIIPVLDAPGKLAPLTVKSGAEPNEPAPDSPARSAIRRTSAPRAALLPTEPGLRRARPDTRWMVLTALGVAISFSVAVGYSLSVSRHAPAEAEETPRVRNDRPDRERSLPATSELRASAPSRPLPARERSRPKLELAEEVESLSEAMEIARSASQKKPARTTRAPQKRAAADLKDPFSARGGE